MAEALTDCWVNGIATDALPVNHRGLHYGDGLFETLAVQDGNLLLWQRHVDRLKRGVQALSLNVDFDALERDVNGVLQQRLPPQSGVLKIILAREYTPEQSRGYAPDTNAKTTRIVQFSCGLPPQLRQVKLITAHQAIACAPNLVGLKTLNALPYVLASQCLTGQDAYDALVSDVNGHVLEGTKTNLFWVNQNDEVCTPKLTSAGVAGVAREEILHRLASTPNAFPRVKSVKLCNAHLCDVLQAKAVFVCNSIVGIVPVSHIDGWPVSQEAVHTVVTALQAQLGECFFNFD